MNWLSAMIHTPIDLRRMYPAEADRKKEKPGTENLTNSTYHRSKVVRDNVLAAMGNDKLTAQKLQKRIENCRDAHSLVRLLRKMEKDGEVICHDVNGNGKGLMWSVK